MIFISTFRQILHSPQCSLEEHALEEESSPPDSTHTAPLTTETEEVDPVAIIQLQNVAHIL
jgi:hypothetical protein